MRVSARIRWLPFALFCWVFFFALPPASADLKLSLELEKSRLGLFVKDTYRRKLLDAVAREFYPFFGERTERWVEALAAGKPLVVPVSVTFYQTRTETDSVAVNPPERRMDFADSFISFLLAKLYLMKHGVLLPLPIQVLPALKGGVLHGAREGPVRLTGIWPLWNRGLGWMRIAERLDLPLGPVIEALRKVNRTLSAYRAERRERRSLHEPVRLIESGIVTGRGKAIPRYGKPPKGKKPIGTGILNGAGDLVTVPGRKISASPLDSK